MTRVSCDTTVRASCGRCHECRTLLTNEDWCPACRAFRRYLEHGYGSEMGTSGLACYEVRARRSQRSAALVHVD